MDMKYRAAGRIMAPRKGYSVSLKNVDTESDQNAQFCNRIGCNGRIKYGQNLKIGSSDKVKYSKPSFRFSQGNEVNDNSARSTSAVTSTKEPPLDAKRKSSSLSKFDEPESSLSSESKLMPSSSSSGGGGGGESGSSSSSSSGYHLESMKSSGNVTVTENRSSSFRPQNTFHQKSGSASSVPSVSKSPALVPYNSSNRNRYGLRNVECKTESDVIPPSCSSPLPKSAGKKMNVMEKRGSQGDSSLSVRGRKTSCGVSSISDSGQSSSASGDSSSGVAASVSGQRSMNVNSRMMRLSCRENGRNRSSSSIREQPPAAAGAVSPQNLDNERVFNVGGDRSLSRNVPSRSYSLSSSDSDNPSAARMPFISSEHSLSNLINRNGITEILLALERIDQDVELTHEQVLALESSLFFSGLNLYDQHRDMRLDIDNMTYEDLLALEERMGTVSTAVSDETLSKCLRRGIYESTPHAQVQITGSGEDGDDIKCSICQEEYATRDEIGILVECNHGYHETCISQWLRVKNWCPICRASAAPTQSSSS